MTSDSVSGSVVVVTGSAGVLGRTVCELAAADPAVGTVLALDRHVTVVTSEVSTRTVDLATADLKPLFEGTSVIVHLAQADPGAEVDDAELAHRVLDAAAAVGARHVVLLSSAAAYGAWANNPVPLTEDHALRPNPGVAVASAKAEIERAAADFRDDHPGTTVTILRPAVAVSPEGPSGLGRLLDRGGRVPVTQDEPPAQFLAVADLAAAIDLARRNRIDGPRNVAPDGWLDGPTARALSGGSSRLRVPERLALLLARAGWRWGLAPTPPELLPLVAHPWVIANDRLKADGWAPSSTNEAACAALPAVGPQPANPVPAVVILGAALVGVALLRRRRHRRS